MRPVRERLGTRPLQSIAKADIEDLMDWMLTAGRKRGGKPGTGLSGRTARLTLGRLSSVKVNRVIVWNSGYLDTRKSYTLTVKVISGRVDVEAFITN